MGIFNNQVKKIIAILCKKSEAISNEISKEIHEQYDDLKSEYEQCDFEIEEYNLLLNQLSDKLNSGELEKLRSFSIQFSKLDRCAQNGIEALRELSRDQKKAARETIREYEEYLYV